MTAQDIVVAIEKVRKAGLVPAFVLLDESLVLPASHPIAGLPVDAERLFGVPFRLSDGFVVAPEGYLAVWNEERL